VFFFGAYDDGLSLVTLFHRCIGHGILYRDVDDISDVAVARTGTAAHPYAHRYTCAGVVAHLQPRVDLNHLTLLITRHRFIFDVGLVSSSMTLSPDLNSFFSS
jgi:hypothetical protein